MGEVTLSTTVNNIPEFPEDLTGQIFGTINDHVAGGGYGNVYRCEWRRPTGQVKVAVKVFKFQTTNKHLRRIRREVAIWARLKHENIVPLLGTTHGFGPSLALVSMWIRHGTLLQLINDKGDRLSIRSKLNLLHDIASGLHYLHCFPVVHGDLTSSNVLVDVKEGVYKACLTDFGLSTVLGGFLGDLGVDMSSLRCGAIKWAAPELLRLAREHPPGAKPTEQNDMYSFGHVMFYILTLVIPWNGVNDFAVLERVLRGEEITRPEPHTTPDISDVRWHKIKQCWSVDADARPSALMIMDFLTSELEALGPPTDDDVLIDEAEQNSQTVSLDMVDTERMSDFAPRCLSPIEDPPDEQVMHEHTSFVDALDDKAENKIIALSMAALNACIIGDLTMAEDILTQEIGNDAGDYSSYANRSFVMARQSDWDRALHDALKSISIQSSLTGYIAKGIALYGKMKFQDAMKAFDIAFMFTDGDSQTMHLLLLVKAIALFNANQHEDAISRVKELVRACPNADILACSVVEAYLRVQLGVNATDHNEAANHFTDAVESIRFSSQSAIHSKYEIFVVLFGWHLKSLWKTANQNRCHALFRAGRITQALKSYRYMMGKSDEATRSDCLDWSTDFKKSCGAHYAAKGDAAFAAENYEMAIKLYSTTISLDPAKASIFVNRCKAQLATKQWEEALIDAQKVIELDPLSHLGYELKHAALHGTQQYDEAIIVFEVMLSKLDDTSDVEIRKLRRQYASSSEATAVIQRVIHTRLDNAPNRLFNTFTGCLCDRRAQINAFKTSTEYKELLSLPIKDADIRMERIERAVVMYFGYVMLSHRWEENEPLLQDIQNKIVYHLHSVGGVVKLQAFCKTARDAGYRWAWIDTCCIDQTNNVDVQKSINSMFVWYRYSALTIVYLLDVPPGSKSGALARSDWNKRGWTVQEFLAPQVVLFYQNDWTLYLGDRSPNHKESFAIMQELADVTGIDRQALVTFRPEMKGAREKLQWASARVTTLQEDMAYSLFGIFGICLPVIYGENKQNALGRLLQEIVARSGDISALDWVGKPSTFNSCLPADITSYKALPQTLPSLSEDQIQTLTFSLGKTVPMDSACKLYNLLENLSAPRFANCRLHLPCITFPVTEITRSYARSQKVTYRVKVNGLMDLLIVTEDKLSTRQTLLLVYPWNRDLLELPNPANDTQSVQSYPTPHSPDTNARGGTWSRWRVPRLISRARPHDSESYMRALRLIVRLGQSFRGFLLAQHGAEYRRVATDHDIIAEVQDKTYVRKTTDIKTIEIL